MVLGISLCQAQDIPYTMVRSNPIAVNPAATGVVPGYRVGVSYRNLWAKLPRSAFPGNFSRASIYADGRHSMNKNKTVDWGWGAMIGNQSKGEVFYKDWTFLASGSLIMDLGGFIERSSRYEDVSLSVGFSYSYNRLSVDTDALIFSDQLNPFDQTILPQSAGFQTGFIQPRPYHRIKTGLLLRIPFTCDRCDDYGFISGMDIGFSAGSLIRSNISLLGQVNITQPLYYATTLSITRSLNEVIGLRYSGVYERARQRDLQESQGRFNNLMSSADILIGSNLWNDDRIYRKQIGYPLAVGLAFTMPLGNNIVSEDIQGLVDYRSGVSALTVKVEASKFVFPGVGMTGGFAYEFPLRGVGKESFIQNSVANYELYLRFTILNNTKIRRSGKGQSKHCPKVNDVQNMHNY
ncbi:MAG: type IX secretion system membrane protein PorP/SprF [Chitinophagales bacterium]